MASPLAWPTDMAVRTLTWKAPARRRRTVGLELGEQGAQLALQLGQALGQRVASAACVITPRATRPAGRAGAASTQP